MDWAEKRVLVTGATGFIGQRMVRRLVKAGGRVYAGVAPDEEPEHVARLPVQVRRLTFDLRNAEAVRAAVAEAAPQVVVHPGPVLVGLAQHSAVRSDNRYSLTKKTGPVFGQPVQGAGLWLLDELSRNAVCQQPRIHQKLRLQLIQAGVAKLV